ncbi:hypothetical protein [Rhizobacter sp. Root1221]|uniref:hypothetical protein n=1 Tax=Rhizobacter sp. Root1221 TaxID=1736433 RepID=UPI0006F241C1|nr:hypothetical protein [Rhizobacter sp. Root1221]KQV99976.1 hypothetical protein ASC87_19950 [Rhizobacter sp. Root1221]
MLALIDGDEIIFKAACATTVEEDWDDPFGASQKVAASFADCRRALRTMMDSWVEAAGCDDLLVCLSPPDRKLFRRGLFPTYKAGRGSKPEHYSALEAYVRETYEIEERPGLEADDVLGILSGDTAVICSSDKDMKTIPGRLYNPGKKTLGVISESRADWQWMYQTLMGDSTDGFSGCLGCGPKGAEDTLERGSTLRDWYPLVLDTYMRPKKGKFREVTQTADDLRVQAALARILRPQDIDDYGHVRYSLGPIKYDFNAIEIAA